MKKIILICCFLIVTLTSCFQQTLSGHSGMFFPGLKQPIELPVDWTENA